MAYAARRRTENGVPAGAADAYAFELQFRWNAAATAERFAQKYETDHNIACPDLLRKEFLETLGAGFTQLYRDAWPSDDLQKLFFNAGFDQRRAQDLDHLLRRHRIDIEELKNNFVQLFDEGQADRFDSLDLFPSLFAPGHEEPVRQTLDTRKYGPTPIARALELAGVPDARVAAHVTSLAKTRDIRTAEQLAAQLTPVDGKISHSDLSAPGGGMALINEAVPTGVSGTETDAAHVKKRLLEDERRFGPTPLEKFFDDVKMSRERVGVLVDAWRDAGITTAEQLAGHVCRDGSRGHDDDGVGGMSRPSQSYAWLSPEVIASMTDGAGAKAIASMAETDEERLVRYVGSGMFGPTMLFELFYDADVEALTRELDGNDELLVANDLSIRSSEEMAKFLLWHSGRELPKAFNDEGAPCVEDLIRARVDRTGRDPTQEGPTACLHPKDADPSLEAWLAEAGVAPRARSRRSC